jgi:hypothetical protein
VRKSSPAVIRPPEPVTTTTASGAIKLTPFERVLVMLPFTVLLVFERPSHEGTESIKRALSQALVHYYPFAGRISSSGADGDDDRFSIRCTGEGVESVAASVDCGLTEAKIFGESSGAKALLDELAVYYPVGSYGSDDPLLSVQVTEFFCGGVRGRRRARPRAAIAVRRSGQVRRRGLQPPSAVGFGTAGHAGVPRVTGHGAPRPARRHGPVGPDRPRQGRIPQLLRRRPAVHDVRGRPRLPVAVPSPRDHARPGDDDPGSPHVRHQHARVRGRQGRVLWQLRREPAAGRGDERPGGERRPRRPRRMVRRAKGWLPDKLKEHESGAGDDRLVTRGLRGRYRYDMLHVSSWRNIGFEGVDLGSGPPARVMLHARGGPGTAGADLRGVPAVRGEGRGQRAVALGEGGARRGVPC